MNSTTSTTQVQERNANKIILTNIYTIYYNIKRIYITRGVIFNNLAITKLFKLNEIIIQLLLNIAIPINLTLVKGK